MIYLQLFWSFFQIGLFSFGGGMAAMPLIQDQVVRLHGWLSLSEFTDLITISQMTPGPIAINSATFVGLRIGGPAGALVSTIGCTLPSCVIVSLLAWVYHKYRKITVIQGALAGLRPTVPALILCADLSILSLSFWGTETFFGSIASTDYIAVLLFFAALFVLRKFRPSPLITMLGCGIIGGFFYLIL